MTEFNQKECELIQASLDEVAMCLKEDIADFREKMGALVKATKGLEPYCFGQYGEPYAAIMTGVLNYYAAACTEEYRASLGGKTGLLSEETLQFYARGFKADAVYYLNLGLEVAQAVGASTAKMFIFDILSHIEANDPDYDCVADLEQAMIVLKQKVTEAANKGTIKEA